MHELSIAEAVIEIASRHADGRKVIRVELRVGHLRQVVPSALQFGFELAAKGTPVEGAQLEIESVPAVGRCRRCSAESELPSFPLQCGACGGFDLEIVTGEELLVQSLEMEDPVEDAPGEERRDGARPA